MSTYVVSVGRSIGTTAPELVVYRWWELRRLVRSAIESAGPAIVFDGRGIGVYEGTTEESATFVAVGEISSVALVRLRGVLVDLAARYGQESIALTIGTTEFVERSAS